MSNDEQKYFRELATKLAPDIEFLRKQWKRFCGMVEDHGAHFVKCATDPRLQYDYKVEKELKKNWDELQRKGCEVYSDQKKAIAAGNKKEAARHRKTLQKIEAQLKLPFDVPPPEPGCTLYWGFSPNKEYGYMDFSDMPVKGRRKSLPLYFRYFWITPGPVNPLPWLLESDPVDLSDNERQMCDCVILSVAHDEGGQLHAPDERVYRHVKKYEERYFKRDTFCQDLWGGLIHDQERVKRAYDCVKPHLDEWRKQPTQAKKQKRGSAAKKKAKKKPSEAKGKTKKKSPSQLLRQTRENTAKQLLKKNPSMTCAALGEKLGCDPSTASRLDAWTKNQQRLKGRTQKAPNGFKRDRDAKGSDVEGLVNGPQADHLDIKQLIEDYKKRDPPVVPTAKTIMAKLSLKDEEEAKRLVKETLHFFSGLVTNTID